MPATEARPERYYRIIRENPASLPRLHALLFPTPTPQAPVEPGMEQSARVLHDLIVEGALNLSAFSAGTFVAHKSETLRGPLSRRRVLGVTALAGAGALSASFLRVFSRDRAYRDMGTALEHFRDQSAVNKLPPEIKSKILASLNIRPAGNLVPSGRTDPMEVVLGASGPLLLAAATGSLLHPSLPRISRREFMTGSLAASLSNAIRTSKQSVDRSEKMQTRLAEIELEAARLRHFVLESLQRRKGVRETYRG